jgi:hypothetical protein
MSEFRESLLTWHIDVAKTAEAIEFLCRDIDAEGGRISALDILTLRLSSLVDSMPMPEGGTVLISPEQQLNEGGQA